MSSGMCKFCTYQFPFKFSLFENIVNMARDDGSVFLKQICHLSLSQPYCIVLQTNINLSLSVFSLIYNNLVLFHDLFSQFLDDGLDLLVQFVAFCYEGFETGIYGFNVDCLACIFLLNIRGN